MGEDGRGRGRKEEEMRGRGKKEEEWRGWLRRERKGEEGRGRDLIDKIR